MPSWCQSGVRLRRTVLAPPNELHRAWRARPARRVRMGWLKQISARLGLGSPSAPPSVDFLVTFEGNSVTADTPDRSDAPRSGALQPGDRIFGDYHINRLLGAGGFGEVYLAEMKPQGRAGLRYVVTGVP